MSLECIFVNNSEDGGNSSIRFENIILNANDFNQYTAIAGSEEEKLYNLGYTYKINVPIVYALELMTPKAVFSLADINTSRIEISSQINCYDGGVTFYSTGIPQNEIKILTLTLTWNGNLSDVDNIVTPDDIGAIPTSALGAVNGVATLDENSKLVQMPTANDVGAIPLEQKGTANGVATLDENGKLVHMPSADDVGAIPSEQKGAANGLATLDSNSKLAQMPNLADVGGSNENLLHNWYFADPIDQRGGYIVPPNTPYYSDTALSTQAGAVSDYTTAVNVNDTYGTITVSGTTYYIAWSSAVRGYTGVGYTIDRWYNTGEAILINDKYITIVPSDGMALQQIFETPNNFWGKTYTFSILTNGKLLSTTFTLPDTVPSKNTNFGEKDFDGYRIYMRIDVPGKLRVDIYTIAGTTTPLNLHAAKLELGTHQTLAHQDADGNWVLNDPPPDKNMELLKCCMSTADSRDTYANKVIYHTGNITAGTADMTAGTTALANGAIYLQYE